MPSAAGILKTDMLLNNNFFLEIDGSVISSLSAVSGLDIEMDVATTTQRGADGKTQIIKSRGIITKPPDISLTRLAPTDATSDALWKWFVEIETKGMSVSNQAGERKNGSVVIYDTTMTEIARFNFYNAWPSKISTDGLSADGNDPIKETITLVCERLERKK